MLGRGGTSVLFEGTDTVTGQLVAIKVLSLATVGEWKTLELFERGTQIVQGLTHDGLPKILGFTRDEGGRMYQIRELFNGGTLESRVREGAHFDRREVHGLLKSLLEVVDYLQRRTPPVLHRDIKPSNVIFRKPSDVAPVLVDFDSAAVARDQVTQTTIVVSPGYTAPEQLMGDAGPASDLFSVGMTVLFAMSREPPSRIERKQGRLAVSHLLSTLEPATAHVLGGLIEPDPSRRYANARDALNDLRGLQRLPKRGSQVPEQPFWNRALEFRGVSLFRIIIGTLLGVLVGYIVLVRWTEQQRADAASVRGLAEDSRR